jgi:RHS repeat-associated protein
LGNSYAWNVEDKMIGANGFTTVYDAFNSVIENNNVEYILPPGLGRVEQMSGQTFTSAAVPTPVGSKVVYTNGSTIYAGWTLPDWRGDVRFTIKRGTSLLLQQTEFSPFGQAYDMTLSNGLSWLFDDSSMGTVVNAYDMDNRMMNSIQGRWVQPDPAGLGAANLGNPQSWNRYAYANNNPLSFRDPSGLVYCTWDGVDSPCQPIIFLLSTGNNALLRASDLWVTATTTQMQGGQITGQTKTTTHLNCGTDSQGDLSCPGTSSVPEITLNPPWGTSPADPLNHTQNWSNDAIAEWLGLTGNPLDLFEYSHPGTATPLTPSVSAVHPPTESTIEGACTYYATLANNGFGNVAADSANASIWNGIKFQQYTQYRRPSTMNPNAPKVLALSPLAGPSIPLQASYRNCKEALGK